MFNIKSKNKRDKFVNHVESECIAKYKKINKLQQQPKQGNCFKCNGGCKKSKYIINVRFLAQQQDFDKDILFCNYKCLKDTYESNMQALTDLKKEHVKHLQENGMLNQQTRFKCYSHIAKKENSCCLHNNSKEKKDFVIIDPVKQAKYRFCSIKCGLNYFFKHLYVSAKEFKTSRQSYRKDNKILNKLECEKHFGVSEKVIDELLEKTKLQKIILLLFLFKLRMGASFELLALIFDVSVATTYRYFTTALEATYQVAIKSKELSFPDYRNRVKEGATVN